MLLPWAERDAHVPILKPISCDLSMAPCADSSKGEAGSMSAHPHTAETTLRRPPASLALKSLLLWLAGASWGWRANSPWRFVSAAGLTGWERKALMFSDRRPLIVGAFLLGLSVKF